ncbi:Actin-like protein 6A [Smittium culicis]|uniref:Actin-like protein 6A n=1 Tax=Smittium culicis TaxID=133412 RepID=A0A1R1Y1G8_9FUNG|nr:Actin-like protein 6A [Smittium culicis]
MYIFFHTNFYFLLFKLDEVNAVVFDIGSNNTRAGFAGEDTPYAYFSTDVGYTNMEFNCDGEVKLVNGDIETKDADGSTKNGDSMDIDEEAKNSSKSANKIKYHVGNEGANVFLSGMNVKKVVSSGTVLDWDAYERIVSYVLKDHLHLNSSEHPVLFSEPNWNDEESREKLTELMFEKFNVPGFFVSKSAALSAFGTGKSTALVIDSGGETTSAVPVYDGYVVQKGIVYQNIGGNYITKSIQEKYLGETLDYLPVPLFEVKSKQNVEANCKPMYKLRNLNGVTDTFRQYKTMQVVSDFKEMAFQVADLPFDGQYDYSNYAPKPYEFPDGYNMVAGGKDRVFYPEVMFQPELFSSTAELANKDNGDKALGVQEMAQMCVSKCDIDLRPHLLHNVVLTGGNTLLPGFTERFSNELPKLCQSVRIPFLFFL